MSTGRIRRGRIAAEVLGEQFTQIYNAALRDKRLSRRARGLLGELLTHRDGFGVSVATLVSGGPEGRDAIRKALLELEKYGYLIREQPKGSGNKFGDMVYTVTDIPDGIVITTSDTPRSDPVTENPTTAPTCEDAQNPRSAPAPDFPAPDFPAPENPPHKKTTSTQNTKCSEEHQLSAAPDNQTLDSVVAEHEAADAENEVKTKRDSAAAIERDMIEARAKAAAEEERRQAQQEQRRNQPHRFPPVEYRGPGNGINGSGWSRADAPPAVPEQPSGPKNPSKRTSNKIPMPEGFRLPNVMRQRFAAQYPELSIDLEFEKFTAKAERDNQKYESWMGAFRHHLAVRESYRQQDEKAARKQGFQPRQQRPAPTMPDGTPMTYPDGSPLVGADLKFAQGMAVAARMKAREDAGVPNPFLPADNPFFGRPTGAPELPPADQE